MDFAAIIAKGGPWKQARIIGGQLLINGDCMEVMAVLPKVDAVVNMACVLHPFALGLGHGNT